MKEKMRGAPLKIQKLVTLTLPRIMYLARFAVLNASRDAVCFDYHPRCSSQYHIRGSNLEFI